MNFSCWRLYHCLFFFLATATTTAFSSPSSNNNKMKVAITGSTGQLGRRAIRQLLDRKIPVKCLIRQDTPPEFLRQLDSDGLLEYVTNGDVTDPVSVKELLSGCSHCLALHGATRRSKWYELFTAAEQSENDDKSHAKQVNYESMKTFTKIGKETKTLQQIVRITGKGEDPWSVFSVLINGLGSMAKGWNYEGEEVLRQQQDVDYTIIRPGVMKTDFDPQEANVSLKLGDNGQDLKVSVVSYDQIAELCIESILNPKASARTTLTAMNVEEEEGSTPSSSIQEKLQLVQRDTRLFPKSLIEEHKKAVKTVFRSLVGISLAIFVGLVLRLLN